MRVGTLQDFPNHAVKRLLAHSNRYEVWVWFQCVFLCSEALYPTRSSLCPYYDLLLHTFVKNFVKCNLLVSFNQNKLIQIFLIYRAPVPPTPPPTKWKLVPTTARGAQFKCGRVNSVKPRKLRFYEIWSDDKGGEKKTETTLAYGVDWSSTPDRQLLFWNWSWSPETLGPMRFSEQWLKGQSRNRRTKRTAQAAKNETRKICIYWVKRLILLNFEQFAFTTYFGWIKLRFTANSSSKDWAKTHAIWHSKYEQLRISRALHPTRETYMELNKNNEFF
jgi:hypothetical protein